MALIIAGAASGAWTVLCSVLVLLVVPGGSWPMRLFLWLLIAGGIAFMVPAMRRIVLAISAKKHATPKGG